MQYLVEFRSGRLMQVFACCRKTAIRKAVKGAGLTMAHVKGCYKF